ncbi:hypothetical protein L0152_00225 [bacterium]|nr:hypothetical protein [bacterium]
MKISDQTIRPVNFVRGSTQTLTYVKPAERPDKADPPTTSIPTEAIPPGGTNDPIVTKDEAKQMQKAAHQRKSEAEISTTLQRTELNRRLNTAIPQALSLEQLNEMAHRKGVSQQMFDEVAARLRQLPQGEFQRESRMIQEFLGTPNPKQAFQVYHDLGHYRQQSPDRFTPEVVRMLTMGTGQSRAETAQGREGILSTASALRVAETLNQMPHSEYNRINDLLNRAGTGSRNANASALTEQALILKAVGARANQFDLSPSNLARRERGQGFLATMQVEAFANEIRGLDRDALIRYTSGINTGLTTQEIPQSAQQNPYSHHPSLPKDPKSTEETFADRVQEQLFGKPWLTFESTNSSAVNVFRAEQDPAYAWAMNRARYDGVNSEAFKNDRISGSMADALRENTNRNYNEYEVTGWGQSYLNARSAAIERIANNLNAGHDVMIRAGDDYFRVITDIRNQGSQREFLLTDPQSGTTTWVTESNLNLDRYYAAI